MPLDPDAAAFLKLFAKLPIPPFSTMTAAQARAQVTPAPLPLEPVASVEDRGIPGPAGEIPVRIYQPADDVTPNGRPLPLLVFFHGGGWVIGTLDAYDGLCRSLSTAAGCVVISVDYRLAPEHKFPAGAEDSYAAVVWAANHATELNADPRRLVVAGDSAGGNLAAAVCLMAKDRGGPPLAYQVLVYPVTDYAFETQSYHDNAEGYFLTREAMIWFWKQYVVNEDDARHPYASPLRAPDLTGLPPALVISAEFDPLRDEGEAFARRLQDAGVAVELERCAGLIHGFLRRTDIYRRAGQTIQRIGRTLRQALT